MTDQLDRLKAALSDRYAIHEQIGAGGMATVYLAEDLKHHRKVVLKVRAASQRDFRGTHEGRRLGTSVRYRPGGT